MRVHPEEAIRPPLSLPLEGEVHLWWAFMDERALEHAGFIRSLSERERARVERLRSDVARRRAAISRGLLRTLLARYLATAPEGLCFTVNPAGKPRLVDPPTDLEFNVSHSGDLWICAIARGRAVGVDVECVRPIQPSHVIPYLAPQERASWDRWVSPFGADHQADALFSLWTCKEAYMKARGLGAELPLDAFVVSAGPNLPPRLISDRRDPEAPQRWVLVDLDGFPGARGALAVERPLRSLCIRTLPVGPLSRDPWPGIECRRGLG